MTEFLRALAVEAADGRQLLTDLERAWFVARAAVASRRRDSHAAAAVDLLAATPLLSATTLAKGLSLAVKNAIRLLDGLVVAGVAVEVTHRSTRRLFGLTGMAPLGEAVRRPYRPEAGRGRGRPPFLVEEPDLPAQPLPPLAPIERHAFDSSDLEAVISHVDQVLRQTRRSLDALAPGRLAECDLDRFSIIVLTEHPGDPVKVLELCEVDEQWQIDKRCATLVCGARFGALSLVGKIPVASLSDIRGPPFDG